MGSKKQRSEEESAPNLVQIMIISLFIILLAFFILLNTIAVVDEQKKLAVLDSLLGNFGVLTGGISIFEGRGGTVSLPDMESNSSHVDFSDMMIGAEDVIQLIRVKSDNRGTVLSIPAHLLFDKWGVTITPSGKKLLDRMIKTLSKNDYPVEIVGHTDNRPPIGEEGLSNRELSSVRAMQILKYFIDNGRFRKDRFTAYGWAEYRPLVTNKTKGTRRLNRRMNIIFVHDKPPEEPRGIFTFKKFFFKVFD